MVGNIPTELKLYAEERFVIGPVVDRDFWSGKRASMAIDRGPCEFDPLALKMRLQHAKVRMEGIAHRTI